MGLGISTPTLGKRTWLIIGLIGTSYAMTEGGYEILQSTSKPVDQWTER